MNNKFDDNENPINKCILYSGALYLPKDFTFDKLEDIEYCNALYYKGLTATAIFDSSSGYDENCSYYKCGRCQGYIIKFNKQRFNICYNLDCGSINYLPTPKKKKIKVNKFYVKGYSLYE